MSALTVLLAVLAAVTLPVTYLFEKNHGRSKKTTVLHLIFFLIGCAVIAADSFLCYALASGLRTPFVGDWAKEFYFGCLWTALPAMLVTVALLCVAALIDHKMKRTRMTLTLILPIFAICTAFLVAEYAEGGEFPVDMYIRALAPGLVLLPHAVPMCEKREKLTKKS